jgi:hypothetical protein
MYLDLFDELRLNKRLVKLAGFEVAAYWAELQSILKQVVKKQTADEHGFFNLDRDYIERETTLTLNKQLKCDDKLMTLGVMLKDQENPNRIAIAVNGMVAVIAEEDTTKLKKTSAVKKDEKAAKIAGMKITMKKAILETDPELRAAYERWVEGMIDAANCRFTKAVIQLFEKTVTEHTADKNLRLKIIEIATVNSYKDATWAINRVTGFRASTPPRFTEQKQYTGVSNNVTF